MRLLGVHANNCNFQPFIPSFHLKPFVIQDIINTQALLRVITHYLVEKVCKIKTCSSLNVTDFFTSGAIISTGVSSATSSEKSCTPAIPRVHFPSSSKKSSRAFHLSHQAGRGLPNKRNMSARSSLMS